MEEKEVAVRDSKMRIDWNDLKTIEMLKATVAKGATDPEFQAFAAYCQSTGLNPIKKEAWCVVVPEKEWTHEGKKHKRERQLQIMTGINGYVEIANKHPQFDGLEKGLIDKEGNLVSLSYPKSDFIGAWCRVYRKDRRRPTEEHALLSEYDQKDRQNKSSGRWASAKRSQILKCAESLALRRAFPQELNGTYTADEMPSDYSILEPQPCRDDNPKPIALSPTLYRYDIDLSEDPEPLERWLIQKGFGRDGCGFFVSPERIAQKLDPILIMGKPTTMQEAADYADQKKDAEFDLSISNEESDEI